MVRNVIHFFPQLDFFQPSDILEVICLHPGILIRVYSARRSKHRHKDEVVNPFEVRMMMSDMASPAHTLLATNQSENNDRQALMPDVVGYEHQGKVAMLGLLCRFFSVSDLMSNAWALHFLVKSWTCSRNLKFVLLYCDAQRDASFRVQPKVKLKQ